MKFFNILTDILGMVAKQHQFHLTVFEVTALLPHFCAVIIKFQT